MSIDIHCKHFDVNVKFNGNEWIVGDETGIKLPPATIIDNLSRYYHEKFLEWCEYDLEKRNRSQRKPMTLEQYMKLGLCEGFEWMERKSKDVLELKRIPGISFFLL